MKGKILSFLVVLLSLVTIAAFTSKAGINYPAAGIVNASGSNLNIRSEASTSSTILGKLSDESYFTIISSQNNFYYIEYEYKTYGYVSMDYSNIVSSNLQTISTGGANLNVRLGASNSSSAFTQISHGEQVIVIQTSNGWSNILFFGNLVGWVNSIYLEGFEVEDEITEDSFNYPAINYNVVSYKQYDARWAYEYLGSSSDTFIQSGCLVTSMAMSESYRTGNNINPLEMGNQLSFTADGLMYWPSNYSQIYSTSNYLNSIYSVLQTGKPVIVGFKTTAGSPHWIIVTGHTGADTLTASDFTVNDPGSSIRTTLAQYLAVYPNFMRIAYYN